MSRARQESGDVIAELADKGQDALRRLTELPGGKSVLSAVNDLRTRVDDLGRRVRGVDALEERIAKLEREVAALKRSQKAPGKAPTRKAPTA